MKAVISPVNAEKRRELDIKSGDAVRVWQKIEEKGKTRLQAFEGLVLAVKHGGEAGGTFAVRRVVSGIGVERIFPLYSPAIDKIEIVKRTKVRRAKLYYIREKVAREIRRQMRNTMAMDVSADSDVAEREEESKTTEGEAEKEIAESAVGARGDNQEAETPQEDKKE